MKSYDELKAEMETIQQQMVDSRRLFKGFGLTAGMLKGALAEAEGRKKK